MSKMSKVAVNERIAMVSSMLIEGKDRRAILQFNSEEEGWGLSERQVDTYIAKAREFIMSETKRDISFEFAKATKRLESLYNKALEASDYRLALAINKEICNIQGLSKIEVEHSGSIEFICSVPD